MTYDEEQHALLHSILEDTFFKEYREGSDGLFGNLELQLTSKCNLKCSYCYYSDKSGHGNELNAFAPWSQIQHNAELVFQWLEKNKYYPKTLDIFSGDTLIHLDGYAVIERAIKFYSDAGKPGLVMIPTNMTFLKNPMLTQKVKDLYAMAEAKGVRLGLSASIDGKYCDPITRQPVADVDPHEYYSDEFYDDVFAFAKEYRCGLHPMMSHENIHVWKQNWDWFQEMLRSYDMPWNSPYMFEVRNEGWTQETVKTYGEVYRYILDFTRKMVGDRNYVMDFILNAPSPEAELSNMNLFNNIGRTGRGIGCSLQTTLFIKLSDLTFNSCHRLSYDALNGFKFIVTDEEITDIEPLNLAFYMATMSMEHRALPYCESCLIKELCNGGCPGAQHEQGDAFTPIPGVCLVEHQKVLTQLHFLKDNNLLGGLLSYLTEAAANTFLEVERSTNG